MSRDEARGERIFCTAFVIIIISHRHRHCLRRRGQLFAAKLAAQQIESNFDPTKRRGPQRARGLRVLREPSGRFEGRGAAEEVGAVPRARRRRVAVSSSCSCSCCSSSSFPRGCGGDGGEGRRGAGGVAFPQRGEEDEVVDGPAQAVGIHRPSLEVRRFPRATQRSARFLVSSWRFRAVRGKREAREREREGVRKGGAPARKEMEKRRNRTRRKKKRRNNRPRPPEKKIVYIH